MRRPTSSRAACTHIHMDKCYGDQSACHLCGRIPAIGFIYVCQQDHRSNLVPTSVSAKCQPKLASDNTASPDVSNLSAWMVDAAGAGSYSAAQFDTLIAQKQHVKDKIQEQTALDSSAAQPNAPARQSLNHAQLAEKLAALDIKVASNAKDVKRNKSAKNKRKQKAPAKPVVIPCDFKCCHTCRPASRDRSFVSFEAVVYGEIQPHRFWNERYMPVANAYIVRGIGLRSHTPADPLVVEDSKVKWKGSQDVLAGGVDELGKDKTTVDNTLPALSSRLRNKACHEDLKSKAKEITHSQNADDEAFRNSVRNSLKGFIAKDEGIPGKLVPPDQDFSEGDDLKDDRLLDYNVWRALMEDLLVRAASTRLPDDDSSESEKSSGKLFAVSDDDHYIEAVALTEEAATTYDANIVVSS